jgi:hypothetical protein
MIPRDHPTDLLRELGRKLKVGAPLFVAVSTVQGIVGVNFYG